MASAKGQARSEPATPIIREDPSHDQLTPTQSAFSSLPYTTVRDFAYPSSNPLHYGPPPLPSIASTPGSARNSGLFAGTNGIGSFLGWWNPGGVSPGGRRLSDSAASMIPRGPSNHPPPLKFADGPPWFEDEDLVSPVIIPSKTHRKHKSSLGLPQGRRLSKEAKMSSIAENLKGGFSNGGATNSLDNIGEPGGTYSATTGVYYEDADDDEDDYDDDSDEEYDGDESRYSKDYHFSIADPDEEMHGKAVALFDFTRENDNELELAEGQVIWVSYRHGQGWLVAEDPRTGESGLVPEEYVRLLKEVPLQHSPDDITSPENESTTKPGTSPPSHAAAVQSHFSTSSKDLERYPHPEHLLDPSYRLGSPPPNIQRDASRPPIDRKDSQKSESAMDIENLALSPSTIDREQFAIQQRRLEDGKVLNGKEKAEQEEYQTLHHKSPSMSGKASPAVQSGGAGRDKDGDATMSSAGKEPEENRGRPVEAR